ncbi:3'-5' exonuclease [Shewanella baltica]|uniref:3'-5' exonuclease n=1 Tax=Shewanella baltica TaxID=62322 RepID=UPI00217D1D23|nr:3'-5' exonuclease [Shewanella baltica]MCS6134014.1 3'-5' exonuclease [Shewanella baltica]
MRTPLAFELAQQWLSDDCVVFDTETTGLGDTDEIVEIALINSRGEVLLNSLVQPCKSIPAEATAIHGITNEMVANAPRISELLHQINTIISGKTLIAYNADFDVRLLTQSVMMCGFNDSDIALHTVKLGCAMKTYAKWYGRVDQQKGEYQWHKLSNAAFVCKATLPEGMQAHRALADCLMTLDVIRYMSNCVDQIRAGVVADFCISRLIGELDRVCVMNGDSSVFFETEVARIFEKRNGYELFAACVNGQLSFELALDRHSAFALMKMFPAIQIVALDPQRNTTAMEVSA